eukprot:900115-Alexandrium_andersonii.AAC.1
MHGRPHHPLPEGGSPHPWQGTLNSTGSRRTQCTNTGEDKERTYRTTQGPAISRETEAQKRSRRKN